jgi:hypothetical protein
MRKRERERERERKKKRELKGGAKSDRLGNAAQKEDF